MIKKMALCAVLILIFVPAFAMAAGAQGQGSGMAKESGMQNQQQAANETAGREQIRTCLQSQQQIANQEQIRTCLEQGNGTCQMIQNQTCDQERDMVRNMTRSSVRQGPASGECKGAGFCGSTDAGNSLIRPDGNQTGQSQDSISGQKRIMSGLESGIGSGDQIRAQVRDSARNQTCLKNGSCGKTLNF